MNSFFTRSVLGEEASRGFPQKHAPGCEKGAPPKRPALPFPIPQLPPSGPAYRPGANQRPPSPIPDWLLPRETMGYDWVALPALGMRVLPAASAPVGWWMRTLLHTWYATSRAGSSAASFTHAGVALYWKEASGAD
jgi:hypothetical protein